MVATGLSFKIPCIDYCIDYVENTLDCVETSTANKIDNFQCTDHEQQ